MAIQFEVSARVVRDELVVRDEKRGAIATAVYNAIDRDHAMSLAGEDGLRVSRHGLGVKPIGNSTAEPGRVGPIVYWSIK